MELLLIDEGVARFQIAGESFTAKKGDLVMVNPYEAHAGETADTELKFRCIDFDASLLGLPNNDSLINGTEKYESLIEASVDLQKLFTVCFDLVSKAKEVLKKHSVSETAVSCGFQNISYFSRVFKSVTGMTPTEYKRNIYELREDK